LDTYPEWRLIDYQPELFTAMLLENTAKEDKQKKWSENIKEDFELWNIQFKDAVASCKDRTAWRRLILSTSSSSKIMDEKRRRSSHIHACGFTESSQRPNYYVGVYCIGANIVLNCV